MGVLVCYDDFTYDVVNDHHLDHLVDTGVILGYDRSEQWVKEEVPLTHCHEPAAPQPK